MTGIEERKADRLRVMNMIYAEAEGNPLNVVGLWEIRESLGLSDEKMSAIVEYLEGERLIKCRRTLAGQMTPLRANITHRGIVEIERSEEKPQEPTDHFPSRASVVINVGGDMIGSPIQANSAGATQSVQCEITIGEDAVAQISAFVDAFDAKRRDLEGEQSAEAIAEIASDVATVRAQLASPKPKKNIIKESLASIRTVLEVGLGGAVTVGLLALLAVVHL